MKSLSGCFFVGHSVQTQLVNVPLLKDKNGDLSSSENYRGITINSIIAKIFEACILHKFDKYFYSHDFYSHDMVLKVTLAAVLPCLVCNKLLNIFRHVAAMCI